MERGRDGEEELEEEEEDEEEDGGPESALEKSPFQLTAADVYDISSVVGRDLLQLRAGPQLPAARARLQFRIVRVLEMLEALVSESSVAEEQLRRERDSLRRELEQLRAAARGSAPQPSSLGPDQMVIDLTDPNRPRFTLQELRDVLQERNQLKAQLLVVQEELQCYKSGIISQKRDQSEELEKAARGSSAGTSKNSEEKTIIKRLTCIVLPAYISQIWLSSSSNVPTPTRCQPHVRQWDQTVLDRPTGPGNKESTFFTASTPSLQFEAAYEDDSYFGNHYALLQAFTVNK
ncbi:RILP-like protein 2 [Turdus rufiventris]|nr:RILP-like protein 2 [Turdus rufiventris]